MKRFVWRRKNGRCRIFRYYRDRDDIVRQEFMYICLQKRDMTLMPGKKPSDA